MIMSGRTESRDQPRSLLRGDVTMNRGPWMSQYNVIINMNSHYQRLSKVKSTIDTSAPKSLSTNTRKRDSVNRSLAMGLDVPNSSRPPSSSRPQTARPLSARPQSARPQSSLLSLGSSRSEKMRPESSRQTHRGRRYHEPDIAQSVDAQLDAQLQALQLLKSEDFEEGVDDESKNEAQREKDSLAERLILMYGGGGGDAAAFPSPLIDQLEATPTSRIGGRHPTKTPTSTTHQQRPQQPLRTRSRAARSGDVLESRSHVFTATDKDFSPRILNKPKATSRLSQSKHYYRPKPKPPIKPSMLAGSSLVSVGDHVGNGDTRSSTPLEDWRLSRDNDDRFETNDAEDVPKLDISLDQDNLRWLKRQESLKNQRQRKVSNELSLASLSEERGEVVDGDSKGVEVETKVVPDALAAVVSATETADDDETTEKPSFTGLLPTKIEENVNVAENDELNAAASAVGEQREEEEEEEEYGASVEAKELIYLKFIQDVTSDLLATGRISERILAEIFKRHVEEYGAETIPPEKADELHRQLRKDLGFGGGGGGAAGGGDGEGLTEKLVRDMDALVVNNGGEEEGAEGGRARAAEEENKTGSEQ